MIYERDALRREWDDCLGKLRSAFPADLPHLERLDETIQAYFFPGLGENLTPLTTLWAHYATLPPAMKQHENLRAFITKLAPLGPSDKSLELPEEILVSITEYLSTHDLGKLALVNKSFARIAKETLERRWGQRAKFCIQQIFTGSVHFFIQFYPHNYPSESQLYTIWLGQRGQLGLNAAENRLIFTGVPQLLFGKARHMAAGRSHFLLLTESGEVWACGHSNEWGQLGLGDTQNRATFTRVPKLPPSSGKVIHIAAGAGGDHSFLLTESREVWACGSNEFGQLGLSDTRNRATFTRVPQLPPSSGKVRYIAAGRHHSFLITENGEGWACGINALGQLGLGGTQDRAAFTRVPLPSSSGKVLHIAAGQRHSCLVTESGEVWACGNNELGQLGLGDTRNRETFTRVPLPSSSGKVLHIAAGREHSCLVTESGEVWACGSNESGQLGLGDTQNRGTFTRVPQLPSSSGKVRYIAAGGGNSFLITENGEGWGCGYNGAGWLGPANNPQGAVTFFTLINLNNG